MKVWVRAPVPQMGNQQLLDKCANQLKKITNQENFTTTCSLRLIMTKKQGELLPLHYASCQEPKEGNGFPCNRCADESGMCTDCNCAGKVVQRYNIRGHFTDFEDKAWITTFHESDLKILGMEAEQARNIELNEGRAAFEAVLRKQYFQQPYQLTVRATPDTFNGEPNTNISCIDVRPVSCGEHGSAMLKEIHEMLMVAPTQAAGA